MGAVGNGGHLIARAPPGDLRIEVRTETDLEKVVFPLHAKSGGDYYLQLKAQTPDVVALPTSGAVFYPQGKAAKGEVCRVDSWCVSLVERRLAMAKLPKAILGR